MMQTSLIRVITACLISLPSAFVSAQTFDILTDADAEIDENSPSTNFGNANVIDLSGATSNPGFRPKGYFKFDASSFGGSITSVESLSFSSAGPFSKRTEWYLLDGPTVDDWTETGITWNNAPVNDTSGDGFSPGPGESADLLFAVNMGPPSRTINLDGSGAGTVESNAETLLLDALNTGNRIATIAGIHIAKNDTNVYSKEGATANSTIVPTITVVPEPSQFAGLAGLSALLTLLALRRRRA